MKTRRIVLLAALLLTSGCLNAQTDAGQSVPKDLVVTLERTPCYGTCPSYVLTVKADGTVTYNGRDHVKVRGPATKIVGREKLLQLVAAFDKAEYFKLKDRYRRPEDGCPQVGTDDPSAITSITINGKSKTIEHDYGCLQDDGKFVYPKPLTELEGKIDEMIGTAEWVR